MSNVSIQDSSSGGSSTLVDTDESTQYLLAVFQELDADSQKLDPRIYKVLKYDGVKVDIKAINEQISDIVNQQQSTSVFAGDIVIIIHNGAEITEPVLKHLERLDTKFTHISGPGNSLIITMTTPPHEGATFFFFIAMVQIINLLFLSVWEPIRDTVRDKILLDFRKQILKYQSQEEPQDQTTLEDGLRQQLQELRQRLERHIEKQTPEVSERPLGMLDNVLKKMLTDIHTQSIQQSPTESSEDEEDTLRRTLSRLLQQLEKENPQPQGSLLDLLLQKPFCLKGLILPPGSFNIPLYIHSGPDICGRVFGIEQLHTATNLLKRKKWNKSIHGSKIPDYSIAPAYFHFVRCALKQPFIPTITVEVGQTDNTTKVQFDCIFTIVGTRFLIDGAYGVDLRVNRKQKVLNDIVIYHFDVTLNALVKIMDSLEGRDKARVSLVIAHKAQQKYNDVRVLELLREWEQSGDTGDQSYQQVLDRISELNTMSYLPYGMAPADECDRASKSAAMDILRDYRCYTNDAMNQEKSDYSDIISKCVGNAEPYTGHGVDREELARKGEALLAEHVFKSKKEYHVNDNSGQSLPFLTKIFTGIRLMERERISLSSDQLQSTFRKVAMLFREDNLDNFEVEVPLRQSLIHNIRDVAVLNYPGKSPDEAEAELREAFRNKSDGQLKLKAKVCHLYIEPQLRSWGITPEEHAYGNKLLFIRECCKRYPNRDQISPSSSIYSSQDSGASSPHLPLQSRKRGRSYSPPGGQDQAEGHTLTQAVRSGLETVRRKVRKQSDALGSRSSSSSTNNKLPRRVSQCLDKVKRFRRRRILPLLKEDSLRSQLEIIEHTPDLLKAFEILLENEVPFIRAYLLNPSVLFDNLYALLERTERAESAEDDNSAEPSGSH